MTRSAEPATTSATALILNENSAALPESHTLKNLLRGMARSVRASVATAVVVNLILACGIPLAGVWRETPLGIDDPCDPTRFYLRPFLTESLINYNVGIASFALLNIFPILMAGAARKDRRNSIIENATLLSLLLPMFESMAAAIPLGYGIRSALGVSLPFANCPSDTGHTPKNVLGLGNQVIFYWLAFCFLVLSAALLIAGVLATALLGTALWHSVKCCIDNFVNRGADSQAPSVRTNIANNVASFHRNSGRVNYDSQTAGQPDNRTPSVSSVVQISPRATPRPV